ncbi:MAG TPA: holo-[acyl-carrier-protein] synthase [Rhodospirillaceae bacterium]|nr:holo-ACP synthase [Alphaproteobacteria bacterium]HBH26410.1 holo-[acyl-carrier-protein] synthase [Rhodospirillaceae bacterium]
MILGLGHDVVGVARVARVLARHPRFAAKHFTQQERAYCDARPDRPAAYARRWAAKEAAAKALGTGIAHGVHLRDIEVTRGADGTPALALHGGAAKALPPHARLHLSMTDHTDIASAVVICESPPR